MFHRKMVKIVTLLGLLCASCCLSAETFRFDNNDKVTITLSRDFDNKLVIKGDKITDVLTPGNTFEKNKEKQTDGSVFLKPLYQVALPVYITTLGGRHVSLRIKGKDGPAKTVTLLPNSPSLSAKHFEKSSVYTHLLEQIIWHLYRGEVPQGYANIPMKSDWQAGPAKLQWRLDNVYRGSEIAAYRYTAKNTLNKPLEIFERNFYVRGVRAVGIRPLVGHRLLPGKSTTVIIISGAPE